MTLVGCFQVANTKHKCEQHFCLNCFQGFTLDESRDKHIEYCIGNEAVRIEMPPENSFVELHDGQYQFKVPFVMYADFESILKPTEETSTNPKGPYTKEISQHIPSGLYLYSTFSYGKVENPLILYRGEDCVSKFCEQAREQTRRLYHMFPEKPMKPLTSKEWKEYNRKDKCHICSKPFKDKTKVRDHCHYTGKYRGPAHRDCDLKFKIPSMTLICLLEN